MRDNSNVQLMKIVGGKWCRIYFETIFTLLLNTDINFTDTYKETTRKQV